MLRCVFHHSYILLIAELGWSIRTIFDIYKTTGNAISKESPVRQAQRGRTFKSYVINNSWVAWKYHWLHPRISQSFILEFIPSLHGKDILHRRLLHLRSFERIWKGSFDARFLLWELLIIDLVRGYWWRIRWATEAYWRKLRCVPLRLIFQKFFARGVQVDNEASVVGWC